MPSLAAAVLHLDLSVHTFRLVSGFTFFRMDMLSQSRLQGVGRTRGTHASVAVFMLRPLGLLCLWYLPDAVFPSQSRYFQPYIHVSSSAAMDNTHFIIREELVRLFPFVTVFHFLHLLP